MRSGVIAILLAAMLPCTACSAQKKSAMPDNFDKAWVYVGTYTGDKSKGIYLYRLDMASGQLQEVGLAAEVVNPTFLAIHPNGRFLYSAGEIGNFQGKPTGVVSAFAIDRATGKLTLLNQQPSGGRGACHVIVDRTGRCLLVANYGSGSAASIPIGDDGRLGEPGTVVQHEGKGPNEKRQEGPHAHSAAIDPGNRFAYVADLGIDRLMIYRLDAQKGTMTPNDPPYAAVAPGAGPRHFTFHGNGKHAYVINELANTITAFEHDPATGKLTGIQTVNTLPDDFAGANTTAEVVVHPSGRFVYGSNRGHDSIAIFACDPQTGRLTIVGHESTRGKTPRNFNIDPTGQYLIAANQGSDTMIVFRIDQASGRLKAVGDPVAAPTPVCIKFLPVR